MVVAGLRFDTSLTGGNGPRWSDVMRSPGGFIARHPDASRPLRPAKSAACAGFAGRARLRRVIPALAIALATLVGTGALVSSDEHPLALLVFVLGMGMALVLVSDAIALTRSVWNWVQLTRSKPGHVRVVSGTRRRAS